MNFIVFSTKGGTGKSRIAISLAVVLSRDTKGKVVLADFDTNQATASSMMEFREQDVPERKAKDLPPVETLLYEEGISQLPTYMKRLREYCDHAVFDTGGYDSEFNRQLISYADCMIIPSRPDYGDFKALTNVFEIIKVLEAQGKKVPEKIFIVLTQCSTHHIHRMDISQEIAVLSNFIKESGLEGRVEVLKNYTSQLQIYSTSAVWGVGITEAGHPRAKDEFERIYSEILSKL